MNLLFDIAQVTPNIPGLMFIENFITEDEEEALIHVIDQQSWITELKRRVQHYGYRYDYKARTVTDDAYLGTLPTWLKPIAKRLVDQKNFKHQPDQVIVNEYQPGQGISAHIDCVPCFGDVVASLTLGAAAIMQLTHSETGQKEELYLKERSLIVLSNEARYMWQHAIPARQSDMIDGFKIKRNRRISLTFRNVTLDKSQ